MKMIFCTLTLIFLFTSCGQDLTNGALRNSTSTSTVTASECNCSKLVDPVCVTFNGSSLTYINGCLAQCDGHQYKSGPCTTDSCNSNSGPVCGTISTDTHPQVYTDECSLLQAGANQVANGQCGI